MANKTVNQLPTLPPESFGVDDLLLVWNPTDGSTRKATIETVATVSGTKGGFTFTSGFERRSYPIYVTETNKWVPLDLNSTAQSTVDQPWWPGAEPSNGVDLFGGSALPFGVSRMLDFVQTWDTSGDSDVSDLDLQTGFHAPYGTPTAGTRNGTLRFDELDTGTTNTIRIDMNVTPQIANSTIEFGLWFQPKLTLDGANDGGAFALTGSPLFFGTGTVGHTYLSRPTTSMYVASSSDQFAYAIPVVRCDNPVIIEPLSTLIQNLR